MAADFTIGQGSTVPTFADTILDENGDPLNLAGATVTFVMRALANASTTINAVASIVSASAGEVSFTLSAAQTSAAGLYNAQWIVTESGGGTYAFPNIGYRSVEVQASLALAQQTLVSVADAKDILNFQTDDDAHDTKILRWIDAAQVVFEQKCGPIIQQNFDEWYDGGQYYIMLRHAPSTALGSSPILDLNFCEVYIGPIEYQFQGVGSPVIGSIYTYELDTFSRVVRRGPGGGIIPFPNVLQSVHVGYTAGQSTVPANIYEAVLEYLREMYQETAQSTSGWGDAGSGPEPIKGFALSGRVLQILGLSKSAPAFF